MLVDCRDGMAVDVLLACLDLGLDPEERENESEAARLRRLAKEAGDLESAADEVVTADESSSAADEVVTADESSSAAAAAGRKLGKKVAERQQANLRPGLVAKPQRMF